MRKVIGIGETILDIIFRDGQPTAAVPGGSVFNGIVSRIAYAKASGKLFLPYSEDKANAEAYKEFYTSL